MSEGPSHYDVLGVPPGATQDAIRRAYRALARAHHPDVSGEPGAQERFGRIAEAYETLSDDRRRRLYDRALREGVGSNSTTSPTQTPHYTWTNVAGKGGVSRPDRTELDEMYDAFFGSEDQDRAPSA